MPGIVLFHRRWSVGSDDLVVPGVFLFTIHLIWLFLLLAVITVFQFDRSLPCIEYLWYYQIGYICILFLNVCIELAICIISMRGSILDTGPRTYMKHWLYFKFVFILVDVAWLVVGIIWVKEFYIDCPIAYPKEIMLGLILCNWLVVLTILTTMWCSFDPAGRSWVKMKKYQRSMRESESRFNYKRSGNHSRNWRQRKVIRAYQDSWDHRCRLLFCCMGSSDRSRNSFTEIARLLSDFFRDLDVVPSDVVAGLVLLRKFQILEREAIVRQKKNGTYEFLSGVPITEKTHFLALNDSKDAEHFQDVIHFMNFALGAYGWPMYIKTNSMTGACRLAPHLGCCLCLCRPKPKAEVIEDNCCFCNYAALKKTISVGEVEIIYATYHVDIGETPFFVAIDFTREKVIVSIRGTLSMKDVLTDLNAEGECLPLTPQREDWLGHKGMIQAAVYIKEKLEQDDLIGKALQYNVERNTQNFGLVLVGHSLGAGTAAILAILLRQTYPDIQCFAYSPPGGLLSEPAVEYSKAFITSIVVGKDVVPRIGLHQMEALRADLINAIQRSVDPKWKTIACSVFCFCCGAQPTSVTQMSSKDSNIETYKQQRCTARHSTVHPNDNSIALSVHQPLYPPGRIIHIVRHRPKPHENVLQRQLRKLLCQKEQKHIYQAIWASNKDFDEVLISPRMIADHMPDNVLAALNKVITTVGPRKPQRQSSNTTSSIASDIVEQFNLGSATAVNEQQNTANHRLSSQAPLLPIASPNAPHKLCLETSFTSLQSPLDEHNAANGGRGSGLSKNSSLAGNYYGGRSQLSSMLQYDISSLVDDSGIPKSMSGPSEATTVIFAEQHLYASKLEDNKSTDVSSISNMPNSSRNAPSTLPLSNEQDAKFKKVDLIYDEWFGLAPLASPESLSELSSISSRASNGITLTSSIDKYLHLHTQQLQHQPKPVQITEEEPLIEPLHTPVIMRRTPKIVGNLSTCADDWKSVNSYKRMGKYFVSNPQRVPSNDDSESTMGSYESANSLGKSGFQGEDHIRLQENSRSADNLDEDGNRKVNMYSGANSNNLAMSDSAILNECHSGCPTCPCTGFSGGECCRKLDHSKCLSATYRFQQQQPCQPRYSFTNTTSSSETNYQSALSSLTGLDFGTPFSHSSPSASSMTAQNGTVKPALFSASNIENFNETLIGSRESSGSFVSSSSNPNNRIGVLESHFPVYTEVLCDERISLLSNDSQTRSSPTKMVRFTSNSSAASTSTTTKINQSSRMKKRNTNADTSASPNAFSRNESLPLLSNLADRSSPQHFVRRKNYVYPASNSPSPSSMHRSKSNGQSNSSQTNKNSNNKTNKRNESNV